MSATMTQLLSSGEFRKLHYDTIPVKSSSADSVTRMEVDTSCECLCLGNTTPSFILISKCDGYS